MSLTATKPICQHCGAPSPQGEFCCAGCAYVYRLVHDEGLDAYYRIKDEVTVRADTSLLEPRDYGWLQDAQREAEGYATNGRAANLVLELQGISCAGCVWLIEKLFSKQPGSGRMEVNAQTGQMRWFWEAGRFDAVDCARTLQKFNYLVGPAGSNNAEQAESRVLIRRVGLCTAFAMNVMLFALPTYFGMESTYEYAPLFRTLQLAFATLSLLAGGGYFLARAVRALRERVLHIDLPIAIGIVMLVGRWAQIAAVERNRRRLLSRQPANSRVRVIAEDGTVNEIAPEAVRVGQRIEVVTGAMVPVEARLETAEAGLSLAWINGEAEPRTFRAGQLVSAGAQNIGRETYYAPERWSQRCWWSRVRARSGWRIRWPRRWRRWRCAVAAYSCARRTCGRGCAKCARWYSTRRARSRLRHRYCRTRTRSTPWTRRRGQRCWDWCAIIRIR
jgi:Cu2+-exporting ATPase